jgi:hypothetical protein
LFFGEQGNDLFFDSGPVILDKYENLGSLCFGESEDVSIMSLFSGNVIADLRVG